MLDKRDPAKELIKLADKSPDKQFKKEIWMFLFAQKYKSVRFVSKPIAPSAEAEMSDEDTLRLLEGNRPVESKPDASSVNVEGIDKAETND